MGMMGYHANIEHIDKQRAQQLLENNYDDNRNIRPTYINQLAEVMSQGRYVSENGQTIVVGDDDGILYDGQHRLKAIIKSDSAYNFIVAYITEGKEKFRTIDNGTPRRASDFINLPNTNICASVAKRMAAIEWGTQPLLSCLQGKWAGKSQVDRGLIVLYCDQYPDKVAKAARQARRMREIIACGSPSDYATAIMMINLIEPNSFIDEFIDDFCELASDNKTIVAYKAKIQKAYANTSKRPESKWCIGLFLDAYYHFCELDNSTALNKMNARMNAYQKDLENLRAKRRQEAQS